MREDMVTPDFPAEQTSRKREESFSQSEAGRGNIANHAIFLYPNDEKAVAALDGWAQEKAKLSLALTERLLRGRDTIAFSELKTSPLLQHERLLNLGEMVLALLRRQAREIIRQEKPLVLQSQRRFDLDDAEIRAELRELRDLLAARLFFDKNELHAALSFGVRLQFDLITRPAATLERLIYPREMAQRYTDVAVILQGLEKSNLFVAQLLRELASPPQALVTKTAFSACCRRAEKEIYGRRAALALVADLQAYQNFCAIIGPSSYHRLEAPTILRMLEERGLQEVAEHLVTELTQQKLWSLSEVERLLEERVTIKHTPSIAPETNTEVGHFLQDAVVEKDDAGFNQVDIKGKDEIDDEIKEKPWQQADLQIDLDLTPAVKPRDWSVPEVEPSTNGQEPGVSEAAVNPEPPETMMAAAAAAPSEEKPSLFPASAPSGLTTAPEDDFAAPPAGSRPKVVYSETEEEPQYVEHAKIEMQPPGPYPSITRLVDEKSRRDFIKKIFHKDLDAYLAFIERIEEMQTWKEAKAFLDHELQQRKVNPYTKEAVRLSDVVFSRYFAKGAK